MPKRLQKIRRSKTYQSLKERYLNCRAYALYKLHNYPKEVGENPIFIFNHIPKCGGTSLNIILCKWFALKKDYAPDEIKFPVPYIFSKTIKKYLENAADLLKLNSWEILAGHYHKDEYKVSVRFPLLYENPRTKLITFVRDPLSHRLSMYKFGSKMGHDFAKGVSLKEYLESDVNLIANSLECDFHNFQERLNSYFFIGITERFEQSISRLSNLLGKKTPNYIPYSNRTRSNDLRESLTCEDVSRFKLRNKLDYLVYNYCLMKFNVNDI